MTTLRTVGDPRVLADRQYVKRFGLIEFCRRAWHVAYPAKPYLESWYHVELTKEIERLFSRQHERTLIVNLPPATRKSTYCWVFAPIYYWLHNASSGIVHACYDAKLSQRDSALSKSIMASRWFVERWGNRVRVDVDRNERKAVTGVIEYPNNQGGFRFATSCPRGALTGRHPGLRGIDDPIKPVAATPDNLATMNAYYGNTFASRAEKQAEVLTMITMQRLAKGDLSEHVASLGGARIFALPAEYNPGAPDPRDPRTEAGQSLDPVALPQSVLDQMRITLGDQYAAQYNQNPQDSDGKIFRREDFKRYEKLPDRLDFAMLSLDCSFKDTKGSDFVCGQAWGVRRSDFFLLGQFHDRLDFSATIKAFLELSAAWPDAVTKLVEDKANGPAVINVLKDRISGIRPIDPVGGKVARANAVSPLMRAGNVWLPAGAPWVERFLDEVCDFPHRKHDDQVDAMTQALSELLVLGYGASAARFVDLGFLQELYRR